VVRHASPKPQTRNTSRVSPRLPKAVKKPGSLVGGSVHTTNDWNRVPHVGSSTSTERAEPPLVRVCFAPTLGSYSAEIR
jgi:hypothetical protein